MNKKGFTLIEMLVVIAIIAVLVSIVIPTVSSATDKAGAATNAANLRAVYAELQTDKLSAGANDDGYVIVKLVDNKLTYSLATTADSKGTIPPKSAKTVGIDKGIDMELLKDASGNVLGVSYGSGKTIEYFATVAETGKAPTNTNNNTTQAGSGNQ